MKGLIVGWFVGGIAYLAVAGLADRAGLDPSTTVVGFVLAAVAEQLPEAFSDTGARKASPTP